LEATIILEYCDEKTADAIARAVSPDNFKTPKGLLIKTQRRGNKILTEIKTEGKLNTLQATIDDLLFCTSTAERTLKVMKNQHRYSSPCIPAN
jgi:tRNA threonylcarbamoyladenosine modification (KEOPS) complex  Pcc1 subunit